MDSVIERYLKRWEINGAQLVITRNDSLLYAKNLEMRVEAENGATAGKTDLAKRAKAAGLDAIHDTVHEMARDEARHGKAFAGLLKRYFG